MKSNQWDRHTEIPNANDVDNFWKSSNDKNYLILCVTCFCPRHCVVLCQNYCFCIAFVKIVTLKWCLIDWIKMMYEFRRYWKAFFSLFCNRETIKGESIQIAAILLLRWSRLADAPFRGVYRSFQRNLPYICSILSKVPNSLIDWNIDLDAWLPISFLSSCIWAEVSLRVLLKGLDVLSHCVIKVQALTNQRLRKDS